MTDEQVHVVSQLELIGLQKASDCYGVVTMRSPRDSSVHVEIEPDGKTTFRRDE